MSRSVIEMFNRIAPSYDRINRGLSLGMDLYWRRKLASLLPDKEKIHLLDCATGTGDQLLSLLRRNRNLHQVMGIDLAEGMLALAKKKLKDYADSLILKEACVMNIPCLDSTFDCVTTSFCVRNLEDPKKALREMYRVLRKGGRLLILEFSMPSSVWFRKGYLLYLNHFLPRVGRRLSSDPAAYSYLAETIQSFPYGEAFCEWMYEAGFKKVSMQPLTFGIVTIYIGDKL